MADVDGRYPEILAEDWPRRPGRGGNRTCPRMWLTIV